MKVWFLFVVNFTMQYLRVIVMKKNSVLVGYMNKISHLVLMDLLGISKY